MAPWNRPNQDDIWGRRDLHWTKKLHWMEYIWALHGEFD